MRYSFASFAVIFTALIALFYSYLGRRLFSFGWPSGRIGWWLLAVPFLLVYLMPLLLFLRSRQMTQSTPDFVFWVVYLSMSFISETLTVVVIRDLVYLGARGSAFFAPGFSGSWPGALESAVVSRVLLASALLLTALGLFQAHRTPALHRVEVTVPGLPAAFDGYKVALLADLHVGPTVKRPFVSEAVSLINYADADLVVFPGDAADGVPSRLEDDLAPLADVRAKDGRFFTTGNHEYYWGAAAWVAEMGKLGWTTLTNDHRVIRRGGESLVLAGIPDPTAAHMDPTNAPDPAKALSGVPADACVLWLSHQPNPVQTLAARSHGLMLSGHTHGGQFFPWTLVLKFFQQYEQGLYRVGGLELYVTPGTAYWGPPNRLGTRSEVALLILRK